MFFEGSKEPRGRQGKFATERAGALLGSFWGHFGIILGYRRRMADVMRIGAGLVGPKSGNVEKVLVFKTFLKGSRGPRGRQPNEQSFGPDRFGGFGRSLWGHFVHFGIPLS